MLEKIQVFQDSKKEDMGTIMYQCRLFFQGSTYGYWNILSKGTINNFEELGVLVEYTKD